LDEELPGYEFLIYAKARENIIGLIVEDPVIPEQTVSSAFVRVEKPDPSRNVVIHKHPSRIHDFSSTDDEYINANNFISILYVNGRFERVAAKVKLPCGHYALVEIPTVDVIIFVEKSVEDEYEIAREIFERQKGNIKKHEPRSVYIYPYYSYYGGYYGRVIEPSSDADLEEPEGEPEDEIKVERSKSER
jgi:hypothetical protein